VIKACVQTALQALEEVSPKAQGGDLVDVDDICNRLAMDCIMRAIYSVEAGAISNPKKSDILKQTANMAFIYSFVLASCVPFLMKLFNVGVVNK